MKTTATTTILAATLLLSANHASAEPSGGGEASVSASMEVQPGAGEITVRAPILVGLSDGAAAEPISVGLDAYYSVNDKLSLGIVHSPFGMTGFYGSARGGFCITGEDNGCPDIYDNVGLDARYRVLTTGNIDLAVTYTGLARSLDPFAFSSRIGAAARYTLNDMLSIDVHPSMFIGVTERDAGYGDVLHLPVTAHLNPMAELGLLVQTGLATPLEDAGDNYAIPLSVGASYAFTDQISAAAIFSLPQLAAGDMLTNSGAVDALDNRTATFSLQFSN